MTTTTIERSRSGTRAAISACIFVPLWQFFCLPAGAETLLLPVVALAGGEGHQPFSAEAKPTFEIDETGQKKQVNIDVHIQVYGWGAFISDSLKEDLNSNEPCESLKIDTVNTDVAAQGATLKYNTIARGTKEQCVYDLVPVMKGFKIIFLEKPIGKSSFTEIFNACGELSAKVSADAVDLVTVNACDAAAHDTWMSTQGAVDALSTVLKDGKWGTMLPNEAPLHQTVFENAVFSGSPDGGFGVHIMGRLDNPSPEVVDFLRDYAKQ